MKSLLQSKEWAILRQAQGWQAHWIDQILILEKKLPLGKSFLYAPEVTWDQIRNTNVIASFAKQSFKVEGDRHVRSGRTGDGGAIFLRIDFIDEFDEHFAQKLKENGFIKSFEEVQPEWRQIIDISKSEEEILAQMKPKGRYNIKVAQKHNIQIKKSSSFAEAECLKAADKQNISDFYHIFLETAKRDGFEIRPKSYFEKLLQILEPKGFAELLVARLPSPDGFANGGQAEYNDKAIAAAIVTYYNKTASYLYGASANEFRNLMAPYFLHWQAIKSAKAKGCQFYDLLAIEPFRQPLTANSRKEDININNYQPAESGKRTAGQHKYAGLTRFKEQFGGRKVHLVGGWDLVYKPRWYKMFKIAEKIRRK